MHGSKRLALALMLLVLLPATAWAGNVDVTLRGSRASMLRQNRVAHALEFSFLRTTADVLRFADHGYLVAVPGNADYEVLADWPYTRPSVLGFIELLSSGYRAACGERLVVTSLTRPERGQPRNASVLSVHPAGMAVDLRVSARARCVRWLEAELLALETAGLVDATREYRPPHFHVAVFPEPFEAHLAVRAADSVAAVAAARADSIQAATVAAAVAARGPIPTMDVAAPPSRLRSVLSVIGWLLVSAAF